MSSYSKLKTPFLYWIPYICYLFIFILSGTSILNLVNTKLVLISSSILLLVAGKDILQKGRIPIFISLIYFVFLIIISITLPLSYVIEDSILQVLLMISFFIVFLKVNTDQNIVKNLMTSILFSTGIFSLFCILFLLKIELFPIEKSQGEQFITIAFGHNNLGHLASLSGIISLYLYFATKTRLYLLMTIFYTSILVISFSRTAYLSFIVSVFLLVTLKYKHVFLKNRKLFILLVIGSITLFSILFIGLSSESRNIPVINSVYKKVISTFQLPNKDLFAHRPQYWVNALKAIVEYPLGIGHGGYTWINLKYTSFPHSFTTSSHNVILDAYVSYGIIGGSLFVSFILLMVLSAIKKIMYPSRNLYSNALAYGLFTMFVTMQFDFVYNIPIYFLLFFMISGVLYQDILHLDFKKVYELFLSVSIILIFIVFQYYFSDLLSKQGQYKIATLSFPFRSYLYRPAIQNEISNGNLDKALELTRWYDFIHGNNPVVILDLGSIYQQIGLYEKANQKYDEYMSLIIFPYLSHVDMIYQFKGKYISQKEALAMKKNYCQRFAIKLRSKASYICEFNKN